MSRKALVRIGAGVVLAAGAVALLTRESAIGRAARGAAHGARRRLHYAQGRARGVRYHLTGQHPDPTVSDDVLADRVRSTLGPLEHALDVPRVHVTVQRHVVWLHGTVGTAEDATAIEDAVAAVSGVEAVASRLHVGLAPGDTRPSAGRRATGPSAARTRLLAAAVDAGVPPDWAEAAAASVLSALAERIPDGELAHLRAHLPIDVRDLCVPARHRDGTSNRVDTVDDLLALVVAQGGVAAGDARAVTESVLRALRSLVPEETSDVAAVLPAELRGLWTGVGLD